MSDIYFTSDHHFGHDNIITHCNRPFDSVKEMDEYMIMEWNTFVDEGDHVYHLGDFAYKDGGRPLASTVEQLNGNITLVMGNHDHDRAAKTKEDWESLFYEVYNGYLELVLDNRIFTLNHYPQESWRDKHHKKRPKGWHLHGHSHGKAKRIPGRMDVGVDTHGFRPWSLEEVIRRLDPRRKPSTPDIF